MRVTRQIGIVLAALLLSCGPLAARDRALVIGVNHYPRIIGGKDLRGAVADAETFAGLLVDVLKFDRSDVKLLVDEAATSKDILDNMQRWLIDGSSPGDRVVLYFAGHGATAKVREPNGNIRLTSTIVPSDASGDVTAADPQVDGMIEGRTIGQYLEKMPGRRIMVVADSCHSGSVTRGVEPADQNGLIRTITPRVPVGMRSADVTDAVRRELKTANRFLDVEPRKTPAGSLAVWHAATIGQVTFDLPDRPGGIFTQTLAEGLVQRKAALKAGGPVTAGRLINYVRENAEAFCAARPTICTSGLTPALEAEPAYRDLVLNPYQPSGTSAPASSGEQAALDAQDLFTHQNDFDLKAEILPGAQVRLRGQVQFRITSARSGTLVVLDKTPEGTLNQIFPNDMSRKNNKDGHANAGAPIVIPDASYGFAFTATVAGRGTLLVLVAEEGADLSDVINRHLDFKAVQDARGLVVELADRLNKPQLNPDLTKPNGRFHWAFVAIPYVIAP